MNSDLWEDTPELKGSVLQNQQGKECPWKDFSHNFFFLNLFQLFQFMD